MEDKIIGRNPVLEAIKAGRSIDKILIKKGKYEGSIIPVVKKAKEAGIITFDANHEMAGKELNFKIELVEIC